MSNLKMSGGSKDKEGPSLPAPQEGQPLLSYDQPSANTSSPSITSPPTGGLPSRSNSATSISSSAPPTRPTTPSKRWSTSAVLTKEEIDNQASRQIINALERTTTASSRTSLNDSRSSSFSRKSLTSMMGGLSSLSLTRSRDGEERGRQKDKDKGKARARSTDIGAQDDEASDQASIRARSQSPFRLRRRARDPSPAVEALSQSDVESDTDVSRIRPRNNAFSLSAQSDDESPDDSDDEDVSDDESWTEGEDFDPVTSRNTERNSLVPVDTVENDPSDIPDPLGEGVNVVIAPEPYFPSTLNASGARGPRRRKSTRPQDMLPLDTSRPVFQRDRCTITLTHGDPAKALEQNGRRNTRYVLASDLSEESRYALEWGIGTVLKDGDELLVVNVVENEAKVDPLIPNPTDRTTKLRSQQERQALAYILVRQVTSLLQRTRLHVTIACQAWHAKNARHMLLDIVDYVEPTMLIVGSRGLGNLKGILLGSTSHYLIQKCSVPVMVARRRLKRPPRRSAHLATHRARVSLAEAGIDRVATKVDQDVAVMREQVERDDERGEDVIEVDDDPETEVEGEGHSPAVIRKVAG